MTNHAMRDIGVVAKYVAPRWKSIVALIVTLLGAVAQLFPNSTPIHAALGFVTMAAATVGVHQVQNAGVAPVQDVVDAVQAVTAQVAPAVAAEVAQVVTSTTTGVLKTAVGTVDATVGAVGDVVGGTLGAVGGLLNTALPTKSSQPADQSDPIVGEDS